MNYSKIIEKYLIDFDELEVGQTLFSIIDKEMVKITFKNNTKLRIEYPRTKEIEFGKGNQDLYLLYFTANPFENLQRVEPVENLEVEAEKYAETQFYDSLEELKNIERAFKSGAEFAQKSTKKEVEREVLVKQYKNEN